MTYITALIVIPHDTDPAIRDAFARASSRHTDLVGNVDIPHQYNVTPRDQESDSDFRARVENIAEQMIADVVDTGLLWQGSGDLRLLQPLPQVKVGYIPKMW